MDVSGALAVSLHINNNNLWCFSFIFESQLLPHDRCLCYFVFLFPSKWLVLGYHSGTYWKQAVEWKKLFIKKMRTWDDSLCLSRFYQRLTVNVYVKKTRPVWAAEPHQHLICHYNILWLYTNRSDRQPYKCFDIFKPVLNKITRGKDISPLMSVLKRTVWWWVGPTARKSAFLKTW